MRQKARTMVCGVMVAIGGAGCMPLAAQVRQPAAQVRRMPPPVEAQGSAMKVSLMAGGQRYESSAPGHCTHAPTASIYGVVSELWTAQQSDNENEQHDRADRDRDDRHAFALTAPAALWTRDRLGRLREYLCDHRRRQVALQRGFAKLVIPFVVPLLAVPGLQRSLFPGPVESRAELV